MSRLKLGNGTVEHSEELFTQSEYAKLLGISRSAITVKIYKQQVNILEIQGGVLIKVSPEEYKELLEKKEQRENEKARHTI